MKPVDPSTDMEILELLLKPGDWIPNNERLPVLIYKGALSKLDASRAFEELFAENGWTGIWRNGVFDYHHYHTGAHEVLGVAAGSAKLMIGGPEGHGLDVSAGDCIVLPAGTGHCNLGSSNDFSVVGAYPPGQQADIQTSAPSKGQLQTIASLSLPDTDPVEGKKGYLTGSWIAS